MYRARSTTYKVFEDLALLIKFRLTVMVVLTAVFGYLIAVQLMPEWPKLLMLAIGGFLLTSGSNILNEVLERDYDRQMRRTMNRPIAAGRMNPSVGVFLAGILSVFGLILLSLLHPLAGILGSISLVTYTFIYTPLKRLTPLAIPIGAIPGALPVLIGWVVATGTINETAVYLFMLQFLWQFPHFWAIGYLGFEDYQKAGFKLLPLKDGVLHHNISRYSLVYCMAILALSLQIAWRGIIVSPFINMILIALSVLFLFFAIRFWKQPGRKAALQLMLASLFFMPSSLLIFLFDVM